MTKESLGPRQEQEEHQWLQEHAGIYPSLLLHIFILIEVPHNQLNHSYQGIPNLAFFDDSIPMEWPHTLE